MEGNAGSTPAVVKKLTVAGNGLCLEYWPVLYPPPQSCQVCLVVTPTQAAVDRVDWEQDCQGCRSALMIQVNLDQLEAGLAAQFAALPLPINQRKTLRDPALLHLIQLLHQEMQELQPMSQLLMTSIMQVLISDLTLVHPINHPRSNGLRF